MQSPTEDSAARLRTAGLKVTRPRQRVLEAFGELNGHHSVDEVVSWLRNRGEPLPRGSVYAIVDDLADHGILQVVDAAAGATLYEIYRHDHGHFVCNQCGAILDIPAPEKLHLPGLEALGSVRQVQVVVRGICMSCQPSQS